MHVNALVIMTVLVQEIEFKHQEAQSYSNL